MKNETTFTLYRDDTWELGFKYNELFEGTYEECLEHVTDHNIDRDYLFVEYPGGASRSSRMVSGGPTRAGMTPRGVR